MDIVWGRTQRLESWEQKLRRDVGSITLDRVRAHVAEASAASSAFLSKTALAAEAPISYNATVTNAGSVDSDDVVLGVEVSKIYKNEEDVRFWSSCCRETRACYGRFCAFLPHVHRWRFVQSSWSCGDN